MACTDQFFTCSNNDLTPEDVLSKLIKTDTNGCPALNTKLVTRANNTCSDYITCSNQDITWKDLVLLLIGTDVNGCAAVRVIDSTT